MKKVLLSLFAVIMATTLLWAKSPSPEELCASLNGLYETDGTEVIVKKIIELNDLSKSDIYLLLQEYINKTYRDANSVIQIEDKESGRIIAKGCASVGVREIYIAYDLKSWHIFKADIKDGKVRIVISSEMTEYEQPANQYSPYKHIEYELTKCYPLQDPGEYFKKHMDGYIFYHSVESMINLMNNTEAYLLKAKKNFSADDEW